MALIREAGYEPKHVIKISKRDSACYLTYGKLMRVKYIVKESNIKRLCIYDQLKPRQFSCLIKELGVEVLDKVMLILRIFQMHAGSREALLQIELARLLHELPLIREWIRRTKLGELPGFLSGGRYAIDFQYEHVRRRLAKIKRELEELRRRKSYEHIKRRYSGWVHVAIIGYTNAGKTTLFNALTKLNKPTGDEMFTTLTPKSYAVGICKNDFNTKIVFVDTIGFIKDLPVEIIEAFKAVLEEIRSADILLFVIDISKSLKAIYNEIDSVLEALQSVGFEGKPTIVALNKLDLINMSNNASPHSLLEEVYKYLLRKNVNVIDVIPISAYLNTNLDILKESLCRSVQRLKNLVNKYTF
jgi:GTP-binding protein HflX